VLIVQYWFYFYALGLPYGLGIVGFGLYYGSKHAGLMITRKKLAGHLVHPRH